MEIQITIGGLMNCFDLNYMSVFSLPPFVFSFNGNSRYVLNSFYAIPNMNTIQEQSRKDFCPHHVWEVQ